MLRFILELYKWLVLVPVLSVSTVLIGMVCLLLSQIMAPGPAGMFFGRLWARINAGCAMMRVSVVGKHNMEEGRSYVVVANHQSQFDILVVYGWLDKKFRWVMKKELRKIPILGICCERLGHIIIDRSNRAEAISALNRAKAKLTDGSSVFFFPEGTRSRNGGLLPFKKGAFRMAVDMELPILPVTIVGTHNLLPRDTMHFKPGRARLVIHPPVETAGCGQEEIPGIMQQVRDTIQSVL